MSVRRRPQVVLVWNRSGYAGDAELRRVPAAVVPFPVRASEVLDFSEAEWQALDEAGMITHDLTADDEQCRRCCAWPFAASMERRRVFYATMGFRSLPSRPARMFIGIETVRNACA